MKDKVSPRSGVLDCEQGSATFYEDDYDFYIMNSAPSGVISGSAEANVKLAQKDEYFCGITHDNKSIAIYSGNHSFSDIKSTFTFPASLYAIQKFDYCVPDWNKIDALCFRGGTLNLLFAQHHIPYRLNGDSIKPIPPKPAYPFSIDFQSNTITISIGESNSEYHSQVSASISGNNGYLNIQFSEPISFKDIPFHIDKIKCLLSFLTFRCNVDFDEIVLQKKLPPSDLLWDCAAVYVNNSSIPTEKSESNNICFDELESTLLLLMDLLYNEQTNNSFTFMNFIPETDSSTRITNDMVKGVVTCLECEIARIRGADVSSAKPDDKSREYLQEEQRLDLLKKELQKVAKDFQTKNGKFSRKTNDMICGTLKHMTLADADKICIFYTKYQGFLQKLFVSFDFVPTTDDIRKLIAYRNKTTHGTQDVLDHRIVVTTYYLIGLLYCMILHGIGIDDKDLESLCSKHFLV